MLTDTHCHLFFRDFAADLPAVMARARAAGVSAFVCVGTDVGTSRECVAIAAREPDVWAAVGIHPHDAAAATPEALAAIRDLATAPRVVAIGEIGLDYFRNLSPQDAQDRSFRAQLGIAAERSLPVLLHCRDAHEDLLRVLREEGGPRRGIAHCYSGGPERVEGYLGAGLHISFAGPVTFKNAEAQRAAARLVPADRLLLETDCPFLTPHPHRGQRNEPAYIRLTAEAVAAARGATFDEVASRTTANARALFPALV
ncbi:MAG: TatD family hydrolase [Planctomycetales bacterium]|nr:TatD family hydrolase [Planctomycetales bacterium]